MAELKNFVRRYTSISAVIDILVRKELTLLDPQTWDDRNDRYFMSLYKDQKKLGGLYALCAARCSETYHHWRVFTGMSDGACIEIKRDQLEAELTKLDGVRFGDVNYLLLKKIETPKDIDIDCIPFMKRIGFAPEEEYRVIAETTDDQKAALSIPFPHSTIYRIYLNPWLPKSIAKSLKDTLRSLPGCSKLRVVRSLLIESDRWKRAGDEIVGKKTQNKLVLRVKPKESKNLRKNSPSKNITRKR